MAQPEPTSRNTGLVSRIQRACIGDGPGIRTTIFLQGCSLQCPWCHNPDYRPAKTSLSRNPHRCINCGRCPAPGEPEPTTAAEQRVAECPAGALTLLGRVMSVDDVMRIVVRDREYYDHSQGGMTLSGGEPLQQIDFALALLQAARLAGIHTAVESACAIAKRQFQRVVGKADLYLCGVKAARQNYRQQIGADPDRVIANIKALCAAGCRVILRVPCIAGLNMDDGLLNFVAEVSQKTGADEVDLLPYHNFGQGKAAMAGLPEPAWETMRTPTAAELAAFRQRLDERLR